MKRLTGLCLVLAASSCLAPVRETSLGTLDADAGGTGGGSLGGGDAATGGGIATGGGGAGNLGGGTGGGSGGGLASGGGTGSQPCGGVGGLACPGTDVCVDDPTDECDPLASPDCPGVCIPSTSGGGSASGGGGPLGGGDVGTGGGYIGTGGGPVGGGYVGTGGGPVGGGYVGTGGGFFPVGGGPVGGGYVGTGGGFFPVGGGPVGGGYIGTGGGTQTPAIPAPAPLPLAYCGEHVPSGGCGDAGPCITAHRLSQSGTIIASAATTTGDGPLGTNWRFGLGPVRTGYSFVATHSQVDTLWYAQVGKLPVLLDRRGVGQVLTPQAPAESTSGVWYFAERSPGVGEVMLAFSSTTVASTLVKSKLPTTPRSNGAAVGSSYFVALGDGVHQFTEGGTEALIARSQSPVGGIVSIAAEGQQVAMLDCNMGSCAVTHLDLSTHIFSTLTASLLGVTQSEPGSLAIVGGVVYALTPYALTSYDILGVETLVYAPNYSTSGAGGFKAASLKAIGSKLYFGTTCNTSGFAPLYGTVEVDPTAKSARWLDLDPALPYVPWNAGFGEGSWEQFNPQIGGSTLYVGHP